MIKTFYFISLISLILLPSNGLAQEEATPTAQENQLEKIQQLKEKVAEKVTEERQKNRHGFFGQIKEISQSTLILTTKKNEITIKISEETKISSLGVGPKKEIDFADLEVGQSLTALGLTEKENELTAKVILIKEKPLIIHGSVSEVDANSGTLTVKTAKAEEFLVDYEKTTKCRIFEKGKGLVNGGLSKIEIGNRVHLVALQGEEASRISARRILVLPGKAFGVVGKEETTPEPTASPSPREPES